MDTTTRVQILDEGVYISHINPSWIQLFLPAMGK